MRLVGLRGRLGRGFAVALASLPCAAATVEGCDATNAIVGGSCAAGYTDCDGQCVQLASDPRNCGTCGRVCASDVCVAGSCESPADGGGDARRDGARDVEVRDGPRDVERRDGTTDGTTRDARADGGDGSPFDAHPRDVVRHDGPRSDGQGADGNGGDGQTGDAKPSDGSNVDQCAPPYVTTASCGSCGTTCAADDVCSPVPDAGTYACAPLCTSPLVDCEGTCADLTSDPLNCGACDHVCDSGICVASMCAGSALGDIVVIGHDYASTNVRVSEGAILANAVFLPPTNPLRVLSFEQYAIASQVTNVQTVLKKAAQTSGRQITFTTVADYTLVPGDLVSTSYDVFLVYDQGDAPTGTLGMVGSTWQTSLASFVAIGGDVVVLDGASGTSPQMPSLLTSAGLLATSADVRVNAGTQLHVVPSGDAVGNFVLSPYAAQSDTVSFITTETSGGNVAYVVDDGADAAAVPVVIHKIP